MKTINSDSQSKDIVYHVSKYFEQQASVPSKTPVNAYIQKTVDATSISERSISYDLGNVSI
jgi:hypothetical protein